MAIRITCPSCDSSLTFDDEKRGKSVRCRKCDEIFKLPAAKRKGNADSAIQEGRKLRANARSRDDEDADEEDEGRTRKKGKKASGGVPVLLLALGGGGALVLLILLTCGIGGWVMMRRPSDAAVAKAAPAPIAAPNMDVDRPPPAVAVNVPLPRDVPAVPDPNADQPLPDSMQREAVERVRQATLYLRVTLADGQMASGTGFLAIEKGLVVTNAHVIGMLQANSKPPRVVEVVLHSGQPNEVKMPGQVLGVDRTSDLAFLRVNHPNLPPLLSLETKRKLFETQKVYVFGFPLGERLGKEITVSPSDVSSLRKDGKSGELDKIQVNGGMQPGNSGGPVVNSFGNVVGIAVSIITGTQLNFAIPVHKVERAMEGRVSETSLEQPVLANGQIRMPVRCACLDPLQRIGRMRVDVWTGPPGAPRPYSLQQPPPLPGDGPRQTHAAAYAKGIGSAEVPLPPIAPGQVYWLQPVITNARGTQWGVAVPTPTDFYPVERKPANLTINFTSLKERTVKIKSSQGLSVFVQNENKNIFASVLDVDLLEMVAPDPKNGFRIRTAFGATNLSFDAGGKNVPHRQPVVDLFRAIPPVYIVDNSNRFLARVDRTLHPQLQKRLLDETQTAYAQLCNSAEAVMLNIPNRVVQPKEKWFAKLPLMLRGGGNPGAGPGPKTSPEIVDLALTCTYEGTRTRDNRPEGLISVIGKVQGRGPKAQNNMGGVVTGKLGFDLDAGFIAVGQLDINLASTIRVGDGDDIPANDYFHIEVTRAAGNPRNIPIPPETKGPAGTPPIMAKGKVIVNIVSSLNPNDPPVPLPKFQATNARMKMRQIEMQAGKTYVISLDSDTFDAYLLLQDANGKIVAEDDDSGGGTRGLNARVEFTCTQTGSYRILATSFDGKLGPFRLRVQEAQ